VKDGWEKFNVLKDTVSTVWDNVKRFVSTGVGKVVESVFWMADKILSGAEMAFGWVPGIGDKLATARGAFNKFRDDVNWSLAGINDEGIKITADMVAREMTSGGNAIALGPPSAAWLPVARSAVPARAPRTRLDCSACRTASTS
jgi:hypothetical protein